VDRNGTDQPVLGFTVNVIVWDMSHKIVAMNLVAADGPQLLVACIGDGGTVTDYASAPLQPRRIDPYQPSPSTSPYRSAATASSPPRPPTADSRFVIFTRCVAPTSGELQALFASLSDNESSLGTLLR